MNNLQLIITALIALWSIVDVANSKIINCHYGVWANYRSSYYNFNISNFDPALCTHISYSFFRVTLRNMWFLPDDVGISEVMALKEINPKLKVLAVVGDWNEDLLSYRRIMIDANERKLFINTTLSFIKEHGFDGLDLYWENQARLPNYINPFNNLIKELSTELRSSNLELIVAVSAHPRARMSYDITFIAQNVDYINVLTYDFVTEKSHVVAFNAPLEGQKEKNVKSAFKYLILQGVPVSKLLMGLAFYGRSFHLANPKNFTVSSPVIGPGPRRRHTKKEGFMGYNEICKLEKLLPNYWSNEYLVPFLHNSNCWVGYDNARSLAMKVDLVHSLNLTGVMISSIELDDFRGKCGPKYPLLNAVNKKLANPVVRYPN